MATNPDYWCVKCDRDRETGGETAVCDDCRGNIDEEPMTRLRDEFAVYGLVGCAWLVYGSLCFLGLPFLLVDKSVDTFYRGRARVTGRTIARCSRCKSRKVVNENDAYCPTCHYATLDRTLDTKSTDYRGENR